MMGVGLAQYSAPSWPPLTEGLMVMTELSYLQGKDQTP